MTDDVEERTFKISGQPAVRGYPNSLKTLREEYKRTRDGKWTQAWVAKKLGLARGTYSVIESGIIYPNDGLRGRIMDLFEVPSDRIWSNV